MGGIGKTSSCISIASALRRMTDRSKAVVIIDCDSQASSTNQLLARSLESDEFVLDDYLSSQCSLDDLLVPVGAGVLLKKSDFKIFKTPRIFL